MKREPSTVTLVARCAGADGKGDRIIGEAADGAFCLGRIVLEEAETPDPIRGTGKQEKIEKFDRLTPFVSYQDIARTADLILAGDVRARTWPSALDTLALGLALITLGKDQPDTPPAPVAGEADASVPPPHDGPAIT